MSDECLTILDAWLVEQKNRIYTEQVKGDNDANELSEYEQSLEKYALDLIKAVKQEANHILKSLSWPDTLMECIREMAIQSEIINNIEASFIRFPFNRSKIHEKELEKEKAGLQ